MIWYDTEKKGGGAMYRVLLVDDDVHILNTNRAYLEKLGYEVVTAADGSEALRVTSSAALDAIVLDVELPGLDGVEVCRRIREASGAPILFLSAYADTDDRIRGLLAGGRRLRGETLFPPGAGAAAPGTHPAPGERGAARDAALRRPHHRSGAAGGVLPGTGGRLHHPGV